MEKSKPFIPLQHILLGNDEMLLKTNQFFELMKERRSVRTFSDKAVPKAVIQKIIETAGTAPSGAHKQPYTFCAVSNPEIKKQIKIAAEQEEFENYNGRMSEEWLKDLEKFDTNHQKPFLEVAPWLIVVFKQSFGLENGKRKLHYYVNESVGIATGFLLAAIHHAGLVALTHTPSPMNFLQKILNRPENEKPFLLIPVGYPAENTQVPSLKRKALHEMAIFFE